MQIGAEPLQAEGMKIVNREPLVRRLLRQVAKSDQAVLDGSVGGHDRPVA